MPRRTLGALVALTLSLAVPAVAGARSSATAKTRHFTATLIGAQISSTENVYDVRGPEHGAGLQFVKANSAGTGGTFRGITYFGAGTVESVGTFTNSVPNADGIVTIKGSARYVRGTGFYKHVRGKYTASGTLNLKNGRLRVLIVATQSL